MTRFDPVDPEELPAEKRSLLETFSNSDAEADHSLSGGTLNVYRTLGRNVDLLEGFREYLSTVWHQSGLTPHERELVILTTAAQTESAYEWHQHVRVALDEGMLPETILAVSRGRHDALEDEHAAIVEYVEQFVDGQVEDPTHERVATHYADEVILGIGVLAGNYLGLAHVLEALEVETEQEFVGWDLENL
ncbi:carboxymuconolactone decarboxylase family protein [Halostagnicola sp. A-GB9-2]|uniref:carboxymuconolactone decarboxylase family protein n=1 Tax=Halostagnicola sp. A-GB9-2 TaxID=3048066 RepID=UPI0024BF116B|nr:carboxymuconolactone decarboxylase family protein [Halostagnicola sp. A-GB9-2]MDJ1431414.1 carboxymuconolactone decarboxylase family protein [Halostagnicola sp. A-GB9-2]